MGVPEATGRNLEQPVCANPSPPAAIRIHLKST